MRGFLSMCLEPSLLFCLINNFPDIFNNQLPGVNLVFSYKPPTFALQTEDDGRSQKEKEDLMRMNCNNVHHRTSGITLDSLASGGIGCRNGLLLYSLLLPKPFRQR